MPTTVKMPDGTLVEMPDNPSPDQVAALEQVTNKASGPMGMLKEAGRVVDKAVRGGVTSAAGFAADAGMYGMGKIMDTLGKVMPEGMAPPIFSEPKEPSFKFGDATKGIQTLGGLLPPISEPQTPTGKRLGGIGESVISAMMPGGAAGTLGARAAIGGAGGAAAEAAGAATATDAKPEGSAVARVLAAVLGSGVTGLAQKALTPNKIDLIKEATSEVNPADWIKAQERKATLNAAGVDSLNTQLIPNSTLPELMQKASSLPSVKPRIETAVKDVPAQTDAAVKTWSNANLNPGVPERREVLHDVQGAAEEALAAIKKRAGDSYGAAVPDGLNETSYSKGSMGAMQGEMRDLIKKYGPTSDAGKAIQKFMDDKLSFGKDAPSGMQADMNKLVPEVPRFNKKTLVETDNRDRIEEAFKQGHPVWAFHEQGGRPFLVTDKAMLDKYSTDQLGYSLKEAANETTVEAGKQSITQKGWVNQLYKDLNQLGAQEGYQGLDVRGLRSIMKKYTPEYQPARDAWHDVMNNDYRRSATGLTGDIANSKGGTSWDKSTITDSVLQNVFNPAKPQPRAVFDLANDIGADKVTDLLREHISVSLNKTMKMQAERGDAVRAPFSFVQTLAGTPAARQNLDAGLTVAAQANGVQPEAVKAGFYKLLDALKTTRDLKIAGSLDSAATGQAAGKNAASLLVAPMSRTSRLIEGITSKKAFNEIADLAISPGGLKELEAIAKAPGTRRAQAMAQTVIDQAMQIQRLNPDE